MKDASPWKECISSLMVGGLNMFTSSTLPPGKLVAIQHHIHRSTTDLRMLVRT
jgi:hypothetical protein